MDIALNKYYIGFSLIIIFARWVVSVKRDNKLVPDFDILFSIATAAPGIPVGIYFLYLIFTENSIDSNIYKNAFALFYSSIALFWYSSDRLTFHFRKI